MSHKRKNYYTTGEVSDIVNLKEHVFRYWEKEFKELSPRKSAKGRRMFTDRDIQIIERIKTILYKEGFTIDGGKKQLSAEMSGSMLRNKPIITNHKIKPSESAISSNEKNKLVARLREIVKLLN